MTYRGTFWLVYLVRKNTLKIPHQQKQNKKGKRIGAASSKILTYENKKNIFQKQENQHRTY